jgi:uncharacterized protein (TIGR04222 family)
MRDWALTFLVLLSVKAGSRWHWNIALLCGAMTAELDALMQNVTTWTGGSFIAFYLVLLAFCCAAAWWIPVRLRHSGRRGGAPDAEDLALLAGGRVRHADSVIADLFLRGGLSNDGQGQMVVAQPGLLASPAGRALLAVHEPFNAAKADVVLAIHANRIVARLRREGLMLRSDQLSRLRWLSIAPLGALFFIGLYRQRAGSMLDEPTGWLIALLGLTAVLAVIRFVIADPRTRAGIEVVERQRAQSANLRRMPSAEEAVLAVALFGTGVLVGTPWEPVHALRQGGSGDGGGGDTSSDSGSDGGGCGD